MTLTPEDLDRLEALAGEATQGKWFFDSYRRVFSTARRGDNDTALLMVPRKQGDTATGEDAANARHIAALDPDTVRELVRGYRESASLLIELRDALSVIAEEYNHCHGCDRHYDYDLKRIVHLPVCLLYEPEP